MSFEGITIGGESIHPDLIKDCAGRALGTLSFDEQGVLNRIKEYIGFASLGVAVVKNLTIDELKEVRTRLELDIAPTKLRERIKTDEGYLRTIIDEDSFRTLSMPDEIKPRVMDALERSPEGGIMECIEEELTNKLIYSTLEQMLAKKEELSENVRKMVEEIMDIEDESLEYSRMPEEGELDKLHLRLIEYITEQLRQNESAVVKTWRNKIFLTAE